jgi:phage shock protein PspC (stress-responsive transcriptional regulator)
MTATTIERLDEMLAAGDISREEYNALRAAVETDPNVPSPRADGIRGLRRDPARRQIGGVCAALADHFGLSTNGLRIVWVVATLILGGVPILIYLALWALIPVNSRRERDLFPVALPLFLTFGVAAVGWGVVVWLTPRLIDVIEQMGARLPDATVALFQVSGHLLGTCAVIGALLVGALIVPCADSRAGRRTLLGMYITAVTFFFLFVLVALWLGISSMKTTM